ncbi:MAG TPA: hypothetical protein VNW90_19240 [Acetobacteraceae bacterium]|jgi:hypothetical protein|nr:hypothetical protein [Acetobacteraceae bacterium]
MTSFDDGKPEVTRRIAVSSPVNGRYYELWRTPEKKPGWHLYGYQNEVEISRKPCSSETRGRIEFERRVEAHSA